jgi:hypothetical protein
MNLLSNDEPWIAGFEVHLVHTHKSQTADDEAAFRFALVRCTLPADPEKE